MAEAPEFTTLQEFIFNTPLYSRLKVTRKWTDVRSVLTGVFRVDGHCPECKNSSTFIKAGHNDGTVPTSYKEGFARYTSFELSCARDHTHTINIHLLVADDTIQKVGQYPSLADIALDESKAYRAVLKGVNGEELHKAIGLASHGVGIGSFVYLRRIFERLIRQRFEAFKDVEGWTEEDFSSRRMGEKIELLKGHLPEFMVKNAKIYGILSQGIHELSEKDCNAFFPIMRSSIVMILDEDKKKLEELRLKAELEQAIQQFTPQHPRA